MKLNFFQGDYYRLGHGLDQHLRKPTPVQGLRGKKVVHVAVGALHCLAVTETGEVMAWGDNDHVCVLIFAFKISSLSILFNLNLDFRYFRVNKARVQPQLTKNRAQ